MGFGDRRMPLITIGRSGWIGHFMHWSFWVMVTLYPIQLGWWSPYTLVSQDGGHLIHWSVRMVVTLYTGQSGWWSPYTLVSQDGGHLIHWSVRMVVTLYTGQSGWWLPYTLVSQDDGHFIHWSVRVTAPAAGQATSAGVFSGWVRPLHGDNDDRSSCQQEDWKLQGGAEIILYGQSPVSCVVCCMAGQGSCHSNTLGGGREWCPWPCGISNQVRYFSCIRHWKLFMVWSSSSALVRANDFAFQKKDFSVSPCSEVCFVSTSSVFMHQRLCYFRNFIINVRTFNRKHQ